MRMLHRALLFAALLAAPTANADSGCHDRSSCISVAKGSTHPSGCEGDGLTASIENRCGAPVRYRVCPSGHGVVDENRCETAVLKPGQREGGSQEGLYWCSSHGYVDGFVWRAGDAADDPMCLRGGGGASRTGASTDAPAHHGRAEQVYRSAAAECPARAACYLAFASYEQCLGRGGAACPPPTCAISTAPCPTEPSRTGGPRGGANTAAVVGQSFARLATAIDRMQAERAQRIADENDKAARRQAKAAPLLSKWRYYTARIDAIKANRDYQNGGWLASPEYQRCQGGACREPRGDVHILLRALEDNRRDVVSEVHQQFAIEDDAEASRQAEDLIDAFQAFEERIAVERAEQAMREATIASHTTRLGPPAALATGVRGATMLLDHGTPIWVTTRDDGKSFDLTAGEPKPHRFSLRGYPGASVLAEDEHAFYWTGQGALYRLPKGGGAPKLVAKHPSLTGAAKLFVDDASVFWLTYEVGTPTMTGSIYRASRRDGSVALLVDKAADFSGVAVGPDEVYWSTEPMGGAANAGRVMAVAKSGGAPRVVAEHLVVPHDVCADGDAVYWLDTALATGVIDEDPRDGRILVARRGAAPEVYLDKLDGPQGLVAVGGWLYWYELPVRDDKHLPGVLKRRSTATGDIEVLAEGLVNAPSFTVAKSALFFADPGTFDNGTPRPDAAVFRVPWSPGGR